jgi:phospholipase/carboxylesterase
VSEGLTGKRVLIVSGARDPIAAPANVARLKTMLERAGATVDHEVMAGGHELSQADVVLAGKWLQANEAALAAVA